VPLQPPQPFDSFPGVHVEPDDDDYVDRMQCLNMEDIDTYNLYKLEHDIKYGLIKKEEDFNRQIFEHIRKLRSDPTQEFSDFGV
jgi:hypothetical protein